MACMPEVSANRTLVPRCSALVFSSLQNAFCASTAAGRLLKPHHPENFGSTTLRFFQEVRSFEDENTLCSRLQLMTRSVTGEYSAVL